jgi:hypothetical protein
LPTFLGVRPVEPDDDGKLDGALLYGREQSPRHLVAAGYAAEDVEEDAPDLLVGGHDVEGCGDLLRVRAAADVTEVRRLAARLSHHVERAHHEPRPVAEDAHVAVELDVLEAHLLRALLLGVRRLDVVQLGDVFVTIQARVVHGDLRVEREDPAVRGDHQRVDLHQARVRLLERPEQVRERPPDTPGRVPFESG